MPKHVTASALLQVQKAVADEEGRRLAVTAAAVAEVALEHERDALAAGWESLESLPDGPEKDDFRAGLECKAEEIASKQLYVDATVSLGIAAAGGLELYMKRHREVSSTLHPHPHVDKLAEQLRRVFIDSDLSEAEVCKLHSKLRKEEFVSPSDPEVSNFLSLSRRTKISASELFKALESSEVETLLEEKDAEVRVAVLQSRLVADLKHQTRMEEEIARKRASSIRIMRLSLWRLICCMVSTLVGHWRRNARQAHEAEVRETLTAIGVDAASYKITELEEELTAAWDQVTTAQAEAAAARSEVALLKKVAKEREHLVAEHDMIRVSQSARLNELEAKP